MSRNCAPPRRGESQIIARNSAQTGAAHHGDPHPQHLRDRVADHGRPLEVVARGAGVQLRCGLEGVDRGDREEPPEHRAVLFWFGEALLETCSTAKVLEWTGRQARSADTSSVADAGWVASDDAHSTIAARQLTTENESAFRALCTPGSGVGAWTALLAAGPAVQLAPPVPCHATGQQVALACPLLQRGRRETYSARRRCARSSGNMVRRQRRPAVCNHPHDGGPVQRRREAQHNVHPGRQPAATDENAFLERVKRDDVLGGHHIAGRDVVPVRPVPVWGLGHDDPPAVRPGHGPAPVCDDRRPSLLRPRRCLKVSLTTILLLVQGHTGLGCTRREGRTHLAGRGKRLVRDWGLGLRGSCGRKHRARHLPRSRVHSCDILTRDTYGASNGHNLGGGECIHSSRCCPPRTEQMAPRGTARSPTPRRASATVPAPPRGTEAPGGSRPGRRTPLPGTPAGRGPAAAAGGPSRQTGMAAPRRAARWARGTPSPPWLRWRGAGSRSCGAGGRALLALPGGHGLGSWPGSVQGVGTTGLSRAQAEDTGACAPLPLPCPLPVKTLPRLDSSGACTSATVDIYTRLWGLLHRALSCRSWDRDRGEGPSGPGDCAGARAAPGTT